MYSGRNIPIIPRKLVHPHAEYILIFTDIAKNTADKLVSTIHGINTYLYRKHNIRECSKWKKF